ncbi:macrolide transporter subunit MacA [Amantichitinum ursilacus]|uniref:Macrolide export protein MacA n=1 Tax=Amantichitinum ursilacus TaxID=857265 RepID=A0A0N1JRK8_9NEIS|nr:macrolide transporter subunit MacA [Amantichitinum ursilacus]KPC49939.1 Macrolide export protein MacA [Amantichitinum ursilacus]
MKLKNTKVRWLIGVLLVVVLALVARHFLFKPAPPQYLSTPVARMDLEDTVLASGTIKPVKQVSVGAQVNGQLKSLKVALGDRVKKGQLLAEIDPVLQENDLRKAEAGLANVQAQKASKQALLAQYQLTLTRQQTMYGEDASAKADLESAQAQVTSTKADLAALDAQIKQSAVEVDTAKANLGYTRITAPMDGEIISVVTQEGQTVVSAQSAPTILIMANLDTMTIKAQVSEADVVRVKAGQPVYFTILGAADKKFSSTLRAVEPAPESISSESSTTTTTSTSSTTAVYYNGLFDVPNPGHVLKTDMTAQVSIVQGAVKQVLAIPVTALGQKAADGSYTVRVVGPDGHAQPRKITTGLNNNVNVQVLTGLALGDKVVVGDSTQIKPASDEDQHRGPPPGH